MAPGTIHRSLLASQVSTSTPPQVATFRMATDVQRMTALLARQLGCATDRHQMTAHLFSRPSRSAGSNRWSSNGDAVGYALLLGTLRREARTTSTKKPH